MHLDIGPVALHTTWKDLKYGSSGVPDSLAWIEQHTVDPTVAAQRRDDQVEDLAWMPHTDLNRQGLKCLEWVSQELPEMASWSPTQNRQQEDVARDALLVTSVLSGWKTLRLVQGFCDAWQDGALGFDGMTAAVTIRAAMEEAARLKLMSRKLASLVEQWAVSDNVAMPPDLVDFADRLLDEGERTGLEEPNNSRWLAVQSVKAATPYGGVYEGGEDGAQYLYGRLSTYVHPKGVSRGLFVTEGSDKGVGLAREPSKRQSVVLMAECFATYLYVADALHSALRDITSEVAKIEQLQRQAELGGLLCFSRGVLEQAQKAGGWGQLRWEIRQRGVWRELVIP